ncbi:MAG: (deoxy)nucleoside triphosphate pyrophosphohydrolase [Caldimicrobium sp.]
MKKKVASAFIEKEGKVLLVKRPIFKKRGGLWEFPGGKIEKGETPEEAIIRELQEELGLIGEPENILAKIEHTYEDETIELFLIKVNIKNEPQLLEADDLIWIPFDEIQSLSLCPADRKLIETLLYINKTLKEFF